MKNVLRISALLTAALMVFMIIGCGGEEETKEVVAPTLVSSNPAAGGEMAANGSVTLNFDKAMKTVTVNGSAATVAGKVATWQAAGLSEGPVTLTIDGTSSDGGALATATLSVTVKAADTTPPDIVSDKCDPANGASGVDPANVTKIVITFTEAMGAAKVDSFEPKDAKVDSKLSDDGLSLTISFLGGYKLSNEMEIKATISGTDKAGNALKTTDYSFTTMKKEE